MNVATPIKTIDDLALISAVINPADLDIDTADTLLPESDTPAAVVPAVVAVKPARTVADLLASGYLPLPTMTLRDALVFFSTTAPESFVAVLPDGRNVSTSDCLKVAPLIEKALGSETPVLYSASVTSDPAEYVIIGKSKAGYKVKGSDTLLPDSGALLAVDPAVSAALADLAYEASEALCVYQARYSAILSGAKRVDLSGLKSGGSGSPRTVKPACDLCSALTTHEQEACPKCHPAEGKPAVSCAICYPAKVSGGSDSNRSRDAYRVAGGSDPVSVNAKARGLDTERDDLHARIMIKPDEAGYLNDAEVASMVLAFRDRVKAAKPS